MTHHADAVVVGGGVMGAATARCLALAGRDVLLVEQHRLGHDHGSSHGSSRIFRLSYPDARWVAMAQQALPRWRALEAETGIQLLALHGGIDLGSAVPAHHEALQRQGAACELLSADAARRRWEFLTVAADTPVLWHPEAGITLADRAWRVLLDSAVRHGCRVLEDTTVSRLRQSSDGVEVDVGSDTLAARVVVVTAGAWAPRLLAGAGITLDVEVTRQTLAYFGIDSGPTPSIVDWGDDAAAYALDAPGGDDGFVIKAGEHHAGPAVDPDRAGGPDPASVDRTTRWVRDHFAGVDATMLDAQTCLYTTTADHDFVLRRHGRIIVGSPCSGHGFKFAPMIGERLAALATADTG